MKSTSAHFHIIGLHQNTSLIGPVLLQPENQILKREERLCVLGTHYNGSLAENPRSIGYSGEFGHHRPDRTCPKSGYRTATVFRTAGQERSRFDNGDWARLAKTVHGAAVALK